MKREYKIFVADLKSFRKFDESIKEMEETINKLGEEGWELVNFVNIIYERKFEYVFKRAKE